MKLGRIVALGLLLAASSTAEHDHSHVHSHDHQHDHHGHHHHDPHAKNHHLDQDTAVDATSSKQEEVVEVVVDDVGHTHHVDHTSREEGHSHQHDEDHGHSHDHRDLRRPIPSPVESSVAPSDHSHEHAHEHSHSHDHSSHNHAHHGHTDAAALLEGKLPTPSDDHRFDASLWAEALFATALVGLAPVLLLFFIPLGRVNLASQQPLLRIFLAFAAGGLLGDALLHLLPHSIPTGHHDHDHSHDHAESEAGHSHSVADLAPYLWMLAGLMTFLMLEKFVRAQTRGGGHGHSHGGPQEEAKKKPSDKAETEGGPVIAAAAYLNLAADFSHNFTDGLAIGATFVHGRSSGWQTTVAMLLHEVPHEIGDFAILIQSGFTRSQAMWTQVYTALGAMVGTAVGLLIEAQTAAWITPFTAGGFVYIACTSVFPELLEDSSLLQSLLQLLAMATGVALMLLIALYE
ncbi:hypothetical protein DYB28_003497 [Aphanomyces astaci]|uniref:Uncharacterized protein n=1 Tax=Aphanomyces astaci TaxID=112090 RepID=A0A9X8HC83_APHAT|nr:hypothetical protein DYB28_003497 [Aphanomyces astaci]